MANTNNSISDLLPLKNIAENEKGKAQSKIYELRRRITDLEKEICHYEGERDIADYFISKIDEMGIKNTEGK